jgi:hypothetical protein
MKHMRRGPEMMAVKGALEQQSWKAACAGSGYAPLVIHNRRGNVPLYVISHLHELTAVNASWPGAG